MRWTCQEAATSLRERGLGAWGFRRRQHVAIEPQTVGAAVA